MCGRIFYCSFPRSKLYRTAHHRTFGDPTGKKATIVISLVDESRESSSKEIEKRDIWGAFKSLRQDSRALRADSAGTYLEIKLFMEIGEYVVAASFSLSHLCHDQPVLSNASADKANSK
jgi:hypothetical protein